MTANFSPTLRPKSSDARTEVMALQQKTGSQPHKSGVPGFIEPSQPSRVARPRSGPLWVHEIKHDGYRMMVRREWRARPLLHSVVHRRSRRCGTKKKAVTQSWSATALIAGLTLAYTCRSDDCSPETFRLSRQETAPAVRPCSAVTMPSYFPVPATFVLVIFPSTFAKRNKSLVAVHIDCLAYVGRCDLPVKRGIQPYTAKRALIKRASGGIAAGSTCHFIT